MQHAYSTAEGRITYSPGVWKHAVRRVVHRVHQSFLAEVMIPGRANWMVNDRASTGSIGRTPTARGFRA
jgi:hypothetical protein